MRYGLIAAIAAAIAVLATPLTIPSGLRTTFGILYTEPLTRIMVQNCWRRRDFSAVA